MIITQSVQLKPLQTFSSTPPKPYLLTKSQQTQELRVCTSRTCRRQGSYQILETLTALAPPTVTVNSCGCLGRCGSGPNVAVLPQGVILSHCGTSDKAARLVVVGGGDEAVRRCLDSLALRKRAVLEIEQGCFYHAETLLSQAIDLRPVGGVHNAYKCRATARLGMGNYTAALDDAREALALAPQDPEAYICEGDVFMAMEQYNAAEKSYSMCLQIDPYLHRSMSFKARVAKLQEKLVAADSP